MIALWCRFFIHAVQPYDSVAGWSRGHLDFSATATAADLSMHGLLGQTINNSDTLCPDDFKFHGQGKEIDYQVPDLQSVDYVYSMFRGPKVTRRLQALKMADPSVTISSTASSMSV